MLPDYLVISLEINISLPLLCHSHVKRHSSFMESYNLGPLCPLPIIDLQLCAPWSIFPPGFIHIASRCSFFYIYAVLHLIAYFGVSGCSPALLLSV